ncbi:unnamed protein product [Blumeria hordei]|uniref:2Fe-2S ferredoxin-type domain-containing protein n=2 Tax=Blumeria hordei TaxID=2867405 RepID=A0A383UI43_BLUHO|nr:2Fe-2S iron-sulfur cluster binding domain-containing protein [Blumeria hordei DH14]SZE99963.1 unnamed protein product [Blumeria hordei]
MPVATSIFQRLCRQTPNNLRFGRKCFSSSPMVKSPRSTLHKPNLPLIGCKSYPHVQKLDKKNFTTTKSSSHVRLKAPGPDEESIHVTFIDKEGNEQRIAARKGENLLSIAQSNDVEMEGACEGSCSCSTCHVIVEDEEFFDKIPEATDEENDMLDLAFGLTETSRLGCQIELTKELDGLRVRLPSMTRNLQASDFSSKSS